MKASTILTIAGISGVMAVGLGAFGAHGLAEFLEENGRTQTFETAALQHYIHTLLLLGLGILMLRNPEHRMLNVSAFLCMMGILFFSGSLYVLCLTNIRILNAVTPIGGVMLILSWGMLALGAKKFL